MDSWLNSTWQGSGERRKRETCCQVLSRAEPDIIPSFWLALIIGEEMNDDTNISLGKLKCIQLALKALLKSIVLKII